MRQKNLMGNFLVQPFQSRFMLCDRVHIATIPNFCRLYIANLNGVCVFIWQIRRRTSYRLIKFCRKY